MTRLLALPERLIGAGRIEDYFQPNASELRHLCR
jgi:hypothetical protein